MDGLLLQDWVTIRGDAGSGSAKVTSIAQSAESWVDIGDYEDLVFFLDVREVTNANLQLAYETAPAKDPGAFAAMVRSFAVTTGQRIDRAFSSMSAVPPARFVRWRLSVPGAVGLYDATFRIWMATYAWRRAV